LFRVLSRVCLGFVSGLLRVCLASVSAHPDLFRISMDGRVSFELFWLKEPEMP
jgi:hypothetical protein